jgi:hypothetical protein
MVVNATLTHKEDLPVENLFPRVTHLLGQQVKGKTMSKLALLNQKQFKIQQTQMPQILK